MRKGLILIALLALAAPCMAEPATTVTREFVPFTKAVDRANLEKQAEIDYARQSLEQQRTDVQNKINAKKEAYAKQQNEQAKKRAELQKQNEAKKQEIEKSIKETRNNIKRTTQDTIYNVTKHTVETPEQIRQNNALDFTNLKNATLNSSVNEIEE